MTSRITINNTIAEANATMLAIAFIKMNADQKVRECL